jgi:hypothetical protein
LAEAERLGVTAAKRHALEEELVAARGKAGEPWAERIAGRRQRVRDADVAVRQHVQANLPELASAIEGDGLLAVQEMVVAAEAFIQAYTKREAVVRALGALLALTGPVRPEDVGPWSRAEQAVRELTRLLAEGEPAPCIQRLHAQADAPAEEAVLA